MAYKGQQMIKTNIKLQVTPEQSAKIQQICFDHRIYWSDTSSDIIHADSKYLFIHDSFITRMADFKDFFEEHKFKEVDAELFIATNESCEGVLVKANGQSFVLSYDEVVRINSTELPKLGYNPNGTCEITNPLEALEADLMESTHTKSHAIPTTDQFAKYGFQTPDFQCKLYDKLDDYILGAYFNPNKQKWTICRWGFDGRNKQGSHNYALTPILVHKPWYETCKLPILINFLGPEKAAPVSVHYYKDKYVYDFRDNKYHVDSWAPLTDAEIEELKRGY